MLLIHTFILSFLTFTINAQTLTGKWPPLDTPPPVNDEWTKLVDFTKVPDAPVVKVVNEGCDPSDRYCNWSCTNCVRTNTTDIIECPNKTDWGLSFDDGPTEFTPGLLDFLDTKDVKITFFVIGSRVFENPQTLQREVAAGHQIGVHTWSHTALTTQTNEEIIAEIKWTEAAIKQAVGLTPKYMRPPYGDVDDRVRAILSQLGYKVVIWDRDTNDWESGEDPTFQMSWVAGNFTEWVKEDDPTGHVSLEHDLYKQTAAQGPLVVPIVQDAGFTIKPVYQCVGDTQPYVESINSTTTATVPTTVPTTVSTTSPTTVPTTTAPTPISSPDAKSPETVTSNAISHINNNYYVLSLALFIFGYFMII